MWDLYTICKKHSLCLGEAAVLMASIILMYARTPTIETTYLYAPGLFGSPIVIGRYCSRYVAHTGEVVYGTRGGDIFGEGTNITAVVFPEILTEKPQCWFRRVLGPPLARSVFMHRFGITVSENANSQ